MPFDTGWLNRGLGLSLPVVRMFEKHRANARDFSVKHNRVHDLLFSLHLKVPPSTTGVGHFGCRLVGTLCCRAHCRGCKNLKKTRTTTHKP